MERSGYCVPFEKRNIFSVSNYRRISPSNSFSKIFEFVVYAAMSHYFVSHKQKMDSVRFKSCRREDWSGLG